MDDDLQELIQRAGAERVSEQLARMAQRSVRIQSETAVAIPVPGASRLGGLPDLPADVSWPRRDIAETPLAFLAQINLGDVSQHDRQGMLPQAGILYFFADPEEPFGFEPPHCDRWRVIYSENLPTSGPTRPPEDLPQHSMFKESAVTFLSEWTLPPYESPMVETLTLSDPEADAYSEAGDGHYIHRLLGHPQQIQGYVPHEVAVASSGHNGSWATPQAKEAMAEHGEWTLLLQLDSDTEPNGMMWGDAGRLYFYIRKQDLVDRRFDRTWLMMQCS